ncbi:MAG: helix-turn-helix transcriptional regulator [Arachnia sp.]
MTHPPGTAVLPAEAGWDQLLFAASGSMRVTVGAGSWTVPPGRALWVPSGRRAVVENRFRVAVRTLYLDADLGAAPGAPAVVVVEGFARELVLHAIRSCPLEVDKPVDRALLTVLIDQLGRLREDALWLPEPTSRPARRAAEAIRRDPGLPLPAVAAEVAVSRRTLERAFVAETGLPLGAWRRRSRVHSSLAYLAEGVSVVETAYAVGYSTPSAFVTAFAAECGRTPGAYLRR